ncbi:hypothetical protein MRX96_039444 [Rhipicephalus microplus]
MDRRLKVYQACLFFLPSWPSVSKASTWRLQEEKEARGWRCAPRSILSQRSSRCGNGARGDELYRSGVDNSGVRILRCATHPMTLESPGLSSSLAGVNTLCVNRFHVHEKGLDDS